MRARMTIPLYQSGCERVSNFICETQGAVRFRTGTKYAHHTRLNRAAVLLPFQYNDEQSYLLEFTDLKMRIFKDGAIITEADVTITGATKADPCVITAVAHGYSNGDEVFIYEVAGMEELNGKSYLVSNVTTDTYEITDVDGNDIDSTAYSTYTSGGVSTRIVEVDTPYSSDEVLEIGTTQNADTMFLCHTSYDIRKLTRASHTSWTMATFVRTADPFTGVGKYPACCSFYEGRIWYGRTVDAPESLWGSRSPDSSGNPRYNNFTLGTDPDHALAFTLAPENGQVDTIQWLAATTQFLAIGTYGGLRKMYGSGYDVAITPTSIQVKPIDALGCEKIPPIKTGGITIYVQRGGLIIRSLEYDPRSDTYVSIDRNLVADHITNSGVIQIAFQSGRPDIFWCVKNNGELIGLTFKSREDVSGWHRHSLGGTDAKCISVGVIPQRNNYDQVWMVVERTIDGVTRRYVEYMADDVVFDEFDDYKTTDDSKLADGILFRNVMAEAQKMYIHLDSAMSYNAYDRTSGVNLTITAITGDITITADSAIFTSDDVNNQVRKKFIKGVGGGWAKITSFVSATEVQATVLVAFNNTDAIADWCITVNHISGLEHLEGATVGVVADGAVHADITVSGGSIDLNQEATVIHIGFRYEGYVKSTSLVSVNQSGASQANIKNISQLGFRFFQTLGAKYGDNLYTLERMPFRTTGDYTDRPPMVFSGIKMQKYASTWEREKHVYLKQTQPLPCVLQGLEIFMDVSDE